ncbi:hypothetical protein FLX56_03855 [Synechococcus moorigangaii CMS01]|nr:hypothetical protein [Synechococcus moorigangaii CMS01]
MRAVLYPALDGSPEAAAALARARWLLAPIPDLTIVCSGDEPSPPSHIARDTVAIPVEVSGQDALVLAGGADLVLAWSRPALLAAPRSLQRRAILDDPHSDLENPASVMTHVTTLAGGVPDDTPALREMLASARGAGRRVLIVGSGPGGVDDAIRFQSAADAPLFVIAIGGAISDERLGASLKVDVVLAWDAAAQLGPSRAAETARHHMRRLSKLCGARIVHPAALSVPFRSAVAAPSLAMPVGFNDGGPLSVQPTRNVLTSAALPLAAALGGPVRVAGVTLQRPAERASRWWAHDREAEHVRAAAALLATHPAFGASAPDEYFDHHYACLSDCLTRMAAAGSPVLSAGRPAPVRMGAQAEAPVLNRPAGGLARIVKWSVLVADRANLRPWLAAGVIFISCLFPSLLLVSTLMIELAVVFLAASGLAVLAVGMLALRARIERASARIEHRLGVQQARQFENLSARLDALEAHVGIAPKGDKLNDSQ